MASIGDDESETEPHSDSSPTRTESALSVEPAHEHGSDMLENGGEITKTQLSDSEIDGEDIGSDDEGYDRENRFQGSSSVWRFYTEEERGLAASLDQQRANDLSIHLYNAHSLKARVRNLDEVSIVESNPSKRRRIRGPEDGSRSWRPNDGWTAWPLEPDDVPRRTEQFGVPPFATEDDKDTYRKPEAWKPSADLEEEIQGLMLKKAHEQFQDRMAEPSAGTEEIDLLADDEKAQTVLNPVVRRIISKLDDMLVALHKDRQRGIHSRSQSPSSGPRSRSTGSLKTRAASGPKTPSQKQREALNAGVKESGRLRPEDGVEDADEGSSSETQRRDRLSKLPPLRGWREVLNTASLVGWNQSAVDRAANRCASLFGGTIAFKKFYHCPVADCKRRERPWQKAWRWREHLKRTHDYSMDEIYKIEANLDAADLEGGLSRHSLGGGSEDGDV